MVIETGRYSIYIGIFNMFIITIQHGRSYICSISICRCSMAICSITSFALPIICSIWHLLYISFALWLNTSFLLYSLKRHYKINFIEILALYFCPPEADFFFSIFYLMKLNFLLEWFIYLNSSLHAVHDILNEVRWLNFLYN